MKCSEISELFSPYIDGEISPVDKKRLEKHLDCCPECADELRQWKIMSAALRDLGSTDITVPAELKQNVMAQIEGGSRSAAKSKVPLSWFSVSRCKGLVAAAASIAILSFGYWGFSAEQDGAGTTIPPKIAQHELENNDSSSGLTDKEPVNEEPGNKEPVEEEPVDKASGDKKSTGTDTKSGTAADQQPEQNSESKNNQEGKNSAAPQQGEPAEKDNAPEKSPSSGEAKNSPSAGEVALLNVEKVSLTASVQLDTAEMDAASAVVKGLAERYQAEYSKQAIDQAVHIQLKVENKDFKALMSDLEGLGELKDKKVQEKDLTPQYKELSAKLQELEGQKQALEDEGNTASAGSLDAQIEDLRVKLAHLDQQAEKAFIALWLE